MASTSCNEIARELLEICLRGAPWPRAMLGRLTTDECSGALFRIVAEGLADRFEPALCRVYEEIFCEALGVPLRRERGLARLPDDRHFERIFVLSRVTLGADVAVTSVMLDAAKRRFPDARIFLAGGRKNWELFAGDPRIEHLPVAFHRGTLRERLAHWPELRRAVDHPDSLVIDPDSRLTQLGLLPVCAEENYLFFESRSYGGDGDDPLPVLASRWAAEMLGIEGARAWIAPAEMVEMKQHPAVAVSLGTGGNPAKRIADPFERDLLRLVGETAAVLWIDKGAGGEEAGRVDRAIAESGLPPGRVITWEGSFARFAAIIRASDLYVGYDSAGQHVAAACGIPLISIFAGFPCARMFARWRPAGPGPAQVIGVDDPDPGKVIRHVAALL